MKHRTFIIAEAGVNHNGSVELAKKLINVASDAGADAVKFQTFKADKLVCLHAHKAEYQKRNTAAGESQYEMIKRLELNAAAHKVLMNHCLVRNILFLSAPFDQDSIDLLNDLGLTIFKIPSGEITNLPYLRKIGSLRKKVIMSTGVANLGEIEGALDVLIQAGTKWEDMTALHCNTEYPTPFEDVNLLAMHTIKAAFPDIAVGYSDHTLGIEAPIAAAALGAAVIEKHFTLDKTMEGPDHKASLEPRELKTMVSAIRNIEKALGTGAKRPSSSELKNKPVVRKSIVASRGIRKGEIFTEGNITVKRPGTGINPMRWDEIIGKIASKSYKDDELIDE